MKKSFTAVFLFALCGAQAGILMADPARAAAHTIVMEGVAFKPETLTIKKGDSVVWVNRDVFPHTATAGDRTFDSGEVAPTRKWKLVAKKSGRFPYLCTLHPTMKGALVVK
jgi:plastocyanin